MRHRQCLQGAARQHRPEKPENSVKAPPCAIDESIAADYRTCRVAGRQWNLSHGDPPCPSVAASSPTCSCRGRAAVPRCGSSLAVLSFLVAVRCWSCSSSPPGLLLGSPCWQAGSSPKGGEVLEYAFIAGLIVFAAQSDPFAWGVPRSPNSRRHLATARNRRSGSTTACSAVEWLLMPTRRELLPWGDWSCLQWDSPHSWHGW
jgi:hypothetical protein